MQTRNTTKEVSFRPLSGYAMLALVAVTPFLAIGSLIYSANLPGRNAPEPLVVVPVVIAMLTWIFLLPGFFIVWGIANWWRRRS